MSHVAQSKIARGNRNAEIVIPTFRLQQQSPDG